MEYADACISTEKTKISKEVCRRKIYNFRKFSKKIHLIFFIRKTAHIYNLIFKFEVQFKSSEVETLTISEANYNEKDLVSFLNRVTPYALEALIENSTLKNLSSK